MDTKASTETQIAVIGTKMENVEKQITEINVKLDRAFVTKQELANLEQKVSGIENTIKTIHARIWAIIVIIIGEVIRIIISFSKL